LQRLGKAKLIYNMKKESQDKGNSIEGHINKKIVGEKDHNMKAKARNVTTTKRS
jgi:hypothetical protein